MVTYSKGANAIRPYGWIFHVFRTIDDVLTLNS